MFEISIALKWYYLFPVVATIVFVWAIVRIPNSSGSYAQIGDAVVGLFYLVPYLLFWVIYLGVLALFN